MITSDNLTYVLDNLDGQEIELAQNLDMFVVELLVCNSGSTVRLRELEEDETEEDITNNGQLYIDFDNLMMLFNESGSLNPWLLELQAEEEGLF
jgi:hypothetical protein